MSRTYLFDAAVEYDVDCALVFHTPDEDPTRLAPITFAMLKEAQQTIVEERRKGIEGMAVSDDASGLLEDLDTTVHHVFEGRIFYYANDVWHVAKKYRLSREDDTTFIVTTKDPKQKKYLPVLETEKSNQVTDFVGLENTSFCFSTERLPSDFVKWERVVAQKGGKGKI